MFQLTRYKFNCSQEAENSLKHNKKKTSHDRNAVEKHDLVLFFGKGKGVNGQAFEARWSAALEAVAKEASVKSAKSL